MFGDPLERLWRDCIFGLCGINECHRIMYRVVITSTLEQRQGWLRDAAETVSQVFPRRGISVAGTHSSGAQPLA
jgi:hypothetical protein